jgi:hypothetical protein
LRMDLSDRFESPLLLLKWANEDGEELDRLLSAYFDSKPFQEFSSETDRPGYISHKIRITAQPPPTVRKLVYRVLSDLRHLFDQMAYSATAAVTETTPAGDLHFPWATNPDDLTTRLGKFPAELHPLFRFLEPFASGSDYEGGDDIIFELRKLAGPAKHRLTLSPATGPVGIDFKSAAGSGDFLLPYDGWNADRSEYTLIHLRPDEPYDIDLKVLFNLTLAEVPRLTGIPILTLLNHYGEYAAFCLEETIAAVESIVAGHSQAAPRG